MTLDFEAREAEANAIITLYKRHDQEALWAHNKGGGFWVKGRGYLSLERARVEVEALEQGASVYDVIGTIKTQQVTPLGNKSTVCVSMARIDSENTPFDVAVIRDGKFLAHLSSASSEAAEADFAMVVGWYDLDRQMDTWRDIH